MPEASISSRGFRKFFGFKQFSACKGRENHLGNAFSPTDHKRFGAVVYDNYTNLAPVIRVNGAWRIDKRNAVSQGKSAPRSYLRLISIGQLDRDTGRNQSSFARRKHNITIHIGIDVHSGRMTRHI